MRFDFGPPDVPLKSGISVVGSQAYVTNFNIAIGSATLDACKIVAAKLRAELQVQCMALCHGEQVEIGFNLQATADKDCPSTDLVLSTVRSLLPAEAILTHSYVVGLKPYEALESAQRGLSR